MRIAIDIKWLIIGWSFIKTSDPELEGKRILVIFLFIHLTFLRRKHNFRYLLYEQTMFYKNEFRITSMEDMNRGTAKKWHIETGSRLLCLYLLKAMVMGNIILFWIFMISILKYLYNFLIKHFFQVEDLKRFTFHVKLIRLGAID